MFWAQVSIIILLFIGLLINANLHGKEKKGKESFWTSFTATILTFVLIWLAGGFSHIFTWPR